MTRLLLQVINSFFYNSCHQHINGSFLLQLVVPDHQLNRTVYLPLRQESCCIQLSTQPSIWNWNYIFWFSVAAENQAQVSDLKDNWAANYFFCLKQKSIRNSAVYRTENARQIVSVCFLFFFFSFLRMLLCIINELNSRSTEMYFPSCSLIPSLSGLSPALV